VSEQGQKHGKKGKREDQHGGGGSYHCPRLKYKRVKGGEKSERKKRASERMGV